MRPVSVSSTQTLLGVLGLALAAVGSQEQWIEFPLSGPLQNVPGSPTTADMFAIMVLASGLASLLSLRKTASVAAVASLTLLVVFVNHVATAEPAWIERYLTESEQRVALRGFLSEHYWPNVSVEPTTLLIKEFDGLGDRLALVWAMLGRGWWHAAIGVVLLLVSCVRIDRRAALVASAAIGVGALLSALPMLAPLNAQLERQRGDELLVTGQAREALVAYREAIATDPILALSRPFISRASLTYLELDGVSEKLGRLAQASSLTHGLSPLRMLGADEKPLRQARFLLSDTTGDAIATAAAPLERAIVRESKAEYRRVRVLQGLLAYSRKENAASEAAFREVADSSRPQPFALFLLAHVLRENLVYAEAVTRLEEALEGINYAPVAADLQCTIGDVYQAAGDGSLARQYYTGCKALDRIDNYRAVMNLGGT